MCCIYHHPFARLHWSRYHFDVLSTEQNSLQTFCAENSGSSAKLAGLFGTAKTKTVKKAPSSQSNVKIRFTCKLVRIYRLLMRRINRATIIYWTNGSRTVGRSSDIFLLSINSTELLYKSTDINGNRKLCEIKFTFIFQKIKRSPWTEHGILSSWFTNVSLSKKVNRRSRSVCSYMRHNLYVFCIRWQ